jgi:hypothetical protein
MAHRIALARVLDFDHLGTHVREEHRAERTGQDAGQIDDADAFELHLSCWPCARCDSSIPLGESRWQPDRRDLKGLGMRTVIVLFASIMAGATFHIAKE